MSAGAAFGSPTSPTQRGRADMEVLAAILRQSAGPLRDRARAVFEASDEGRRQRSVPLGDRDDVADRLARAKA